MFHRAAATALFVMLGLPAAAACTGDGFYDLMTPQERTELAETAAGIPYSKGLLWTATRDNDTLTVIGTMHIHDPRLEITRARVQARVRTADLVMLEATPTEEAQLKQAIFANPGLFLITDGPTLPELLDEETWQMVAAAATERGIPSFMAAKMQPWYLSLTLAIPACALGDMMAGLTGLDKMIIADATNAGVPLQAVEPYTTLFSLFINDDMDEQVDMLRVSMLVPDLQEQMFVSMLDLYFEEEIGKLWDMSRMAMAKVPGLDPAEGRAMYNDMQEALLDARNIAWIPVITQAAVAHDDIVVAVGAAHLIGELGILRLLENDGWTITRIP